MSSQQVFDSSIFGELSAQKSLRPHGAAAHLSRFSNSVAAHGSSRYDMSREVSTHSQWPEEHTTGTYNQLNDSDSSYSLLGKDSSNKKDKHTTGKESAVVRNFQFAFSSVLWLKSYTTPKNKNEEKNTMKEKYTHRTDLPFSALAEE